jgi:YgiT-type zinc finger domain-containing protein
MNLKTCTQCGGKNLKQTLLDHHREVGGTTFEGEVPGRVCATCGSGTTI